MTEQMPPELLNVEVSRRGFVAGSAGLTFAVALGAGMATEIAEALGAQAEARPNARIH